MPDDVCLCDKIVKFLINTELRELGNMNLFHIAELFGVSHSYLCRCFKKKRKTTFNSCFVQIKLLKCALLIHKNPNISVKEMSKISGFSDQKYFTKVFKKYFNKAPSKYYLF